MKTLISNLSTLEFSYEGNLTLKLPIIEKNIVDKNETVYVEYDYGKRLFDGRYSISLFCGDFGNIVGGRIIFTVKDGKCKFP
ncbi:MAG: hypothetical protein J7K98_02645 [Candidatus Aenigmarchaeota archaeon]|nr:hypothetical protein [Candidatus Aenigmarchaeota archaeon]